MKEKKEIAMALAILQCAMLEGLTTDWETLYNASEYLRKQARFSKQTGDMIMDAASEAWAVGRIQERL